jgi:ABC-type branched-subunit amino acid transport system ATPase component
MRAGYGGADVLSDVDFEAAAGEVVTVLGRNGAGKTTLLNAIAGLVAPRTPGCVELAGVPLSARRAHLIARAGVALVPQGRRLFALTVAEHLRAATAAAGKAARRAAPPGGGWSRERVLELLPKLGSRLQHRADQLSGGEQQMLALARALLTNPRLLLLDEPSEGLAPAVAGQIAAALRQLATGGLAVVLAEQNLGLALGVADRVVILAGGRVAMACPTIELLDPHREEDMYALLGVATPQGTGTAAPARRRPGVPSRPRP